MACNRTQWINSPVLRNISVLSDAFHQRRSVPSIARSNSGDGSQGPANNAGGRRLTPLNWFRLRPYGSSLMTPAVSAWLGSAWVVILLMASIEGLVWGAVGASLVPSASSWLRAPVAGFMFLLMFSIVWIVDSSLIMSERPSLRLLQRHAAEPTGLGASARWLLGLLVRVSIVAISLYVTAPFIEKLVRADDIAGWHQARVEHYFKDRDATIQAQVSARAAQMDAGLSARISSLEQEIARLSESVQAEQQRRARIEAEYAPEIGVLTRDLAEARARVGDEVLGRDGRPEGYGPEARKWDARVELIQAELSRIQAELDERLSGLQSSIAQQQQRLSERSDALEQVRIEQARLIAQVTDAVTAEQPPPAPPRLTFAARSKGLSELRNSPDEAGVPHFETVEGFAQAALGILFFALIALKLFEPTAVHAYYSETTQLQYQKYLAGGLLGIPGFEHHNDPARRLSPVAFYRLWACYERDPDAYFEQARILSDAEARVRRLQADQDYELQLLERHREDIDHRLALENRRREAELTAHERELAMQLQQTERRLASETDAEIERLEAERAEARRAHALEMDSLSRRFAAERERLDQELARTRADWEQRLASEQEALDRQRRAFDEARRAARNDERLRQLALDDQRRLRERELSQAAADDERKQQRAARALCIEQTRALIADERKVQAQQREALLELHDRLTGFSGEFAEQQIELRRLAEALAERQRRRETLLRRIDEAARAMPTPKSIWPLADQAVNTHRKALRQLRQLDKERERMQRREQTLRASLARLETEREGTKQARAKLERETAKVDIRIARHCERLDSLLLARG